MLNTREEGRRKCTDLVKNTVSITARHRLYFWGVKTGPKSNLLSSKYTEHYKNNCFISQAQNTIALQTNGFSFLTGIHWIRVTSKARSVLPIANHCQGQMQSSQSVSIHLSFCSHGFKYSAATCVNTWKHSQLEKKNTTAYTNNQITWLLFTCCLLTLQGLVQG